MVSSCPSKLALPMGFTVATSRMRMPFANPQEALCLSNSTVNTTKVEFSFAGSHSADAVGPSGCPFRAAPRTVAIAAPHKIAGPQPKNFSRRAPSSEGPAQPSSCARTCSSRPWIFPRLRRSRPSRGLPSARQDKPPAANPVSRSRRSIRRLVLRRNSCAEWPRESTQEHQRAKSSDGHDRIGSVAACEGSIGIRRVLPLFLLATLVVTCAGCDSGGRLPHNNLKRIQRCCFGVLCRPGGVAGRQ